MGKGKGFKLKIPRPKIFRSKMPNWERLLLSKQAITPAEYDPAIMAELLEAFPTLKGDYDRELPDIQRMYRNLIVHQGIYASYLAFRGLGQKGQKSHETE